MVVDPIQSVKGKVVIDAFRLIPPQNMISQRETCQTTSNIGHLHKPSIVSLIHGLNRHYYSMPIAYRKNELEEAMLLNVHKQAWTGSLSLKSFTTHACGNEAALKGLVGLAEAYGKGLKAEIGMSEEELKVRHVGKQDPKRHLKERCEGLIGDNVVQTLGSMLNAATF